MVKELMHDPIFLARKAEDATAADLETARDLLDTLLFHRESCVGMAANMIGVCKRIIAFQDEKDYTVMFNPVILKAAGEYEAEEGCLSLLGGPRKAKRYQKIKVEYKIPNCRSGSRPMKAGPPRSSSTRSTIVTEF